MFLLPSPALNKLRQLVQRIHRHPDLPKSPRPAHRYAHQFPDPAMFTDPSLNTTRKAAKTANGKRTVSR